MTDEEMLERIEAARDEGYEAGYRDGAADGNYECFSDGVAVGYDEGYEDGLAAKEASGS